jgi:SpoVK/Ycf46/Vps4 family AAA+-type ATPase
MLLRFFDLYVNHDETDIDFRDIGSDYFKGSRMPFNLIKTMMTRGANSLMSHYNFIEHKNDNGMRNTQQFALTQKAKDEFLSELNLNDKKTVRGKDFILASSIKEKKLFYNKQQCQQIDDLASLLQEENFKSIQNRLSENGMRNGFACLFYGTAGTGKTESVYQIARKTNRDILMVDISQMKTCWYGESEKLVKNLFVKYRNIVRQGSLAPILLFNEADALISKRLKFNDSSRSTDMSENSIQNIILQEIENLEGILIATTNMTQNMDKAFERRFIYKIEFFKPDINARQEIWKSIMTDLDEESIQKLAIKYDFSGGQIENIARKSCVGKILYGQNPSIEKLDSFCREEISNKDSQKKIGFNRLSNSE